MTEAQPAAGLVPPTRKPVPAAAAPVAAAAPAPTDDATEEAAAAVTATKRKDPYLDAIRRIRDYYATLPLAMRRKVHAIVGDLYVNVDEDEAEATEQH